MIKQSRLLEIAIVVVLVFMVGMTIVKTSEKPSESVQNGHFQVLGEGSGGSSFNITKKAQLHYEASGSTFNIYVGTIEQLSNYGKNSSFSYNEELSRINASNVVVDGYLDAGNYEIIIEKIGEFNVTLDFFYDVTYSSASVLDNWYPQIMLASIAITLCLSVFLIFLKRAGKG